MYGICVPIDDADEKSVYVIEESVIFTSTINNY